MSHISPSFVLPYTPSAAVQACLTALKEERRDEALAYQRRLEKEKAVWEAELLFALEEGSDALSLKPLSRPIDTTYTTQTDAQQLLLLNHSSLLSNTLSLSHALLMIQAGLLPTALALCTCYEPLVKDRAVFRIEFLQKMYPLLHEHAKKTRQAIEAERTRLKNALATLDARVDNFTVRLRAPPSEQNRKAETVVADLSEINLVETGTPVLVIEDLAETVLSFGPHQGRTYAQVARSELAYCEFILRAKFTTGALGAFKEWLEVYLCSTPNHILSPKYNRRGPSPHKSRLDE